MQVTIDIPEPLYREMESEARNRHISVQEVAAFRLSARHPYAGGAAGRRVAPPLLCSDLPGTVDLNQNFNDAAFDDFDAP